MKKVAKALSDLFKAQTSFTILTCTTLVDATLFNELLQQKLYALKDKNSTSVTVNDRAQQETIEKASSLL